MKVLVKYARFVCGIIVKAKNLSLVSLPSIHRGPPSRVSFILRPFLSPLFGFDNLRNSFRILNDFFFVYHFSFNGISSSFFRSACDEFFTAVHSPVKRKRNCAPFAEHNNLFFSALLINAFRAACAAHISRGRFQCIRKSKRSSPIDGISAVKAAFISTMFMKITAIESETHRRSLDVTDKSHRAAIDRFVVSAEENEFIERISAFRRADNGPGEKPSHRSAQKREKHRRKRARLALSVLARPRRQQMYEHFSPGRHLQRDWKTAVMHFHCIHLSFRGFQFK